VRGGVVDTDGPSLPFPEPRAMLIPSKGPSTMNGRSHALSPLTPRLMHVGVALFLLVGTACASKGSPQAPTGSPGAVSTSPGSSAAALTILSPHSGDRVSAPVPIRYTVQGFVPDSTSLIVYLGQPGSSMHFELPLPTASGVVRLDDHPMLSGKRTLTIRLAVNHQPLPDGQGQVILRSLIIEGSRGAA
jgi:hypothetical protein